VRDTEVQRAALADVTQWVVAQGWEEIGAMESPITGKEGNREFLLAVRKKSSSVDQALPSPISANAARPPQP